MKRLSKAAKIAFIILGLYCIKEMYEIHQGSGTAYAADELPNCSSDDTKDYIKKAIEDSPAGRSGYITVNSVEDLRDFDFNRVERYSPELAQKLRQMDVRVCTATVYTNAGVTNIYANFKWVDKKAGKWYLQTEENKQAFSR